MNGRRRLLLPLFLAGAMVATWPMPALAASQPNLGTAASFAVLAGSTITNTNPITTPTTINGDVGVSPGNALTGFPPGVINGTIHLADPVSLQAQKDLKAAYNNAAGQAANANLTGMDLGGKKLMAGTYRFSSSAQLTGTLTLDGPGVYLFQIGSTLTTASLASVLLINGATPCGVYWQVGSSATLGTGTSFQGTMMALASITVTTGTTLVGRALARNGAVTLDTNTITKPTPSCAPGSGGGGGNNVCGNSNNNNDNDNDNNNNNNDGNKIADNKNAANNNGDNNDGDNNDENDNNKDKDRHQCNFGPFASASTDSGTCGVTDWAQDTFNRSFTVTQNSDGTFAVREDFTKGRFTTIAGASPGACEGSSTPHGTLVAAGKKGNFHGYLAGTTTGIFNKHGCDSGGCDSTAGFIAHVFGPGAAYTCSTGVGACSFFFTYQANGQGLKFHHWINASTDLGGNRGDIATS